MATPNKLIIYSFKDEQLQSYVGKYQVLVNPEEYNQSYTISYDQQKPLGASGVTLKFNSMGAQQMDFKLLFDATGAIPNSVTDLAAELQNFLSVVCSYQGSIHQPYYLKIIWGKQIFPARLTKLSIRYSLFRPDGSPLRAHADLSFSSSIDPNTLAKMENKQSADLTHLRTVTAGDTLPSLCHQIYGDATLYPKVAAFNRLTHFRSLRPGMQLEFPPLK
jgi:Contractile injection system tube protein